MSPIRLALAMAVALLGACATDLRDGQYACAPETAGACPPGWACECHGARCEWLCYSRASGTCGDDVLGPGEECDGEAISTQHRCATGFSYCLSDCTVACTACGDGKAESTPTGAEACDDGNLLSHDGCSSECLPEEPQWLELLPRGTPPPRADFAMAYDAARGRLVMFGGVDRGPDVALYRSDTWEWDGRAWLQVSPGSGPSARSGHAMTYDSTRRKIILFGGSSRGVVDPSVWEWDGARWQRVSSVGAPTALLFHALAYDSRRGRVMYLGGDQGLWEWDGATRAWARLASTGEVPPPATRQGMVYDPARDKLVVVDGASEPSRMWEWDRSTTTWSQVSSVTAPPSSGRVEALTYDLKRRRIVLVQGVENLWEWDPATKAWTKLAVAAPAPEPRNGFEAAYYPPSNKVVLFGGNLVNDTLQWDGQSWEMMLSPAAIPPSGALLYDPLGARTLAVTNDTTRGVETWDWSGQLWSRLVPTNTAPSSLLARNVALDPRRRRIFGYRDTPPVAWEWTGTAWQTVTEPPSPPWPFSAVVYNAGDRKIHLFGRSAAVDEAKWDGTQWQLGAFLGSRRIGAAFAYDLARDRTVLFSGFDGTLTREETWELSGTTWTRRMPPQSPRPTDLGAMTYDPARKRTVLVAEGRTWEWDGEDWNDVTPITPGPSFPANLTYDATQQAVIASSGGGKVWALRYEHPRAKQETCRYGIDADRDGRLGCDDPDCWAYCSPMCPPGQTCDAADPRCGDGTCSATLESCALCPQDCGACPAACGDFVCTTGETSATCPGDCP